MKKNIVEKKEVINSKNKNVLIEDDCEVNINNGNIASLIPKLPNIISALSEKELCVHELSSLLKMKQPSISQHLKTLWQAKVVKKRKVGLHVFYRLDDEHIEKIYTWGYEHVKE